MTLQRMDNVLIVVDDLEAAKAFFAELGMELVGETQVEGPSVDTRTRIGSATSADLKASSSAWPSSS
jgi:catechol 2,3-dioxygenase-like lactoylglutathione lyase family enzyme